MEIQYDIRRILEFLPHRYPFVLVDRILALDPGKQVKALKNVTMNEPFFQGHFPELPIMPGVLIVEFMAQAGAVLVLDSLPEALHGAPIYFMGIDKARFRKPVVPGDQVIAEVEVMKMRAKTAKLAGTAMVDGQRVAEAELLANIGEPS